MIIWIQPGIRLQLHVDKLKQSKRVATATTHLEILVLAVFTQTSLSDFELYSGTVHRPAEYNVLAYSCLYEKNLHQGTILDQTGVRTDGR